MYGSIARLVEAHGSTGVVEHIRKSAMRGVVLQVSLRNRSLCNLYAVHIQLFASSETPAVSKSADQDVTVTAASSKPSEGRKTLKERSPRRLLPRGSLTEPFDPSRSGLSGSGSTLDSSGTPIPFPGMRAVLDHLEGLVDLLRSNEAPDGKFVSYGYAVFCLASFVWLVRMAMPCFVCLHAGAKIFLALFNEP